MVPTGSVTPDTTFFTSATLASLYGPTATLALLTVTVTLLVIVAGLIAEFRNAAALRRLASSGHPQVAAPVESAAPLESASPVGSRQEAA